MDGKGDLDTGTQWPGLREIRRMGVSYAQNFEDVRLARALTGDTGFYIDIGANEPVYHSVTKRFYDRGWRGVNIEPQPSVFERLRDDRPEDANLNLGVSDHAGLLTFYETPDHQGLSSFHPWVAETMRLDGQRVIERSIPVITLREVCERHAGNGQTIEAHPGFQGGGSFGAISGVDSVRWADR